MMADIRRVGAVLDGLAGRVEEFRGFAAKHLAPGATGRVYGFGCGDGLFALEAMGRPAIQARTALDMVAHEGRRLTAADRVLAVSMSGNVDRTVAAAQAALAAGAEVAVLTNGDGGRLGVLGCPSLSLDVPSVKAFLCGTTTYTATLAGLAMMTGRVAGAELLRLAPLMARIVDESLARIPSVRANPTAVRFLASGANGGSAAYGAAKLVELTRTPAWSADIEEFAHSQFWAADAGDLIVYLCADAATAAIATDSAAALADMGFDTLAIEVEGAPVPSARSRVTLPSVSLELSPLLLAVPLQVLAWRIAVTTGFDPDTRAHLKDDAVRFATSRRLTRKSLLGTGH